ADRTPHGHRVRVTLLADPGKGEIAHLVPGLVELRHLLVEPAAITALHIREYGDVPLALIALEYHHVVHRQLADLLFGDAARDLVLLLLAEVDVALRVVHAADEDQLVLHGDV